MLDYYEILEVHPKASREVIKKAYIVLSKRYHPDTTEYEKGFALEKMKELNEAHAILSDPQKRKNYNAIYFNQHHSNNDNSKEEQSNDSYERKEENNNSSAGENSFNTALNFAKEDLLKICSRYTSILNDKIIRDINFYAQNAAICKPLLNSFYNETEPSFKLLNSCNMFAGDVADEFCKTLWNFAVAFTYSNDYREASSAMNMAAGYIFSSSPYYLQFIEARNAIQEGFKKQTAAEESAITNQENIRRKKYKEEDDDGNSGCGAMIVKGILAISILLIFGEWGFFILILIYLFSKWKEVRYKNLEE